MFSAEIRNSLEPLYSKVYDNVELISSEIEKVATLLKETADHLLPCMEPRKRKKWRDDTLSCLCVQSRKARMAWKDAGSPAEGPLYDEKNRLRCAVRKRVRWCAAKSERLRVQQRDRLFATQESRRFVTPQRRKAQCSKLVVDGNVVREPDTLLKIWADHFQRLTKSRLGDTTKGLEQQEKIRGLESQSHANDELLLDVPFTTDEVSRAVAMLKKRKAPGPDGLMAEHLKAGGESVVIWLMKILNAIVELESMPEVLKRGVVVPVYKGGGKDPLQTDSYRGSPSPLW